MKADINRIHVLAFSFGISAYAAEVTDSELHIVHGPRHTSPFTTKEPELGMRDLLVSRACCLDKHKPTT
jgi:hypothetical protein